MDVRMKRLREEQLYMVMDWRMRPYITKYMNTDPILTIEGQKAWFQQLQYDESQLQWVIYVDEKPAGMLSLADIDRKNERCSWGYYIAETQLRSLKLAVCLEWNLYDYVFLKMNLHKLCNETFVINEQIVKIHQMCGSRQDGIMRQHIRKEGIYYDVSVGSILREEWMEKRKELHYDTYEFES